MIIVLPSTIGNINLTKHYDMVYKKKGGIFQIDFLKWFKSSIRKSTSFFLFSINFSFQGDNVTTAHGVTESERESDDFSEKCGTLRSRCTPRGLYNQWLTPPHFIL